mmetsp:Transcript_8362/g.21563  ORF Transcript_8362/g.21563 Transcript_8362/m.21563 type:complete len:84 (-) Transcript_8362:875-1126(-)
MLFYSFFKTLTGKEVTVELKNDLAITGTLHSVDQYLNIKLNNIKVVDEVKHPHLVRTNLTRAGRTRSTNWHRLRSDGCQELFH